MGGLKVLRVGGREQPVADHNIGYRWPILIANSPRPLRPFRHRCLRYASLGIEDFGRGSYGVEQLVGEVGRVLSRCLAGVVSAVNQPLHSAFGIVWIEVCKAAHYTGSDDGVGVGSGCV